MNNLDSRYHALRHQMMMRSALTNPQDNATEYNTRDILAMLDLLNAKTNDRTMKVKLDTKSAKKATADLMSIFNKSIK